MSDKNRKSRDWLGDVEPGGMQCQRCSAIFIGSEWRSFCWICAYEIDAEVEANRAIHTTERSK